MPDNGFFSLIIFLLPLYFNCVCLSLTQNKSQRRREDPGVHGLAPGPKASVLAVGTGTGKGGRGPETDRPEKTDPKGFVMALFDHVPIT